ncbi:unnamed protein product [Caretta caretta]
MPRAAERLRLRNSLVMPRAESSEAKSPWLQRARWLSGECRIRLYFPSVDMAIFFHGPTHRSKMKHIHKCLQD